MRVNNETIAAVATPPGRGGIGIIRLSGAKVPEIAEKILGKLPSPRVAHFAAFNDAHDEMIDEGVALFFPAPHSFTGEDVLELQGHGGPVVMDLLLQRVLSLGARLAKAGEFSERAFLNDKVDLAQAEAIADLIDAGSAQAARAAIHSLQGEFSQYIHQLVEQVIHLRMYVEASIDFTEEEIDFLSDGKIAEQLKTLLQNVQEIQQKAQQGVLLREGMIVVIAGKPNAGKSSLLNQFSGRDTAIVTAIPGTTRDILREHIQIDGMPLQIIDTAGLRDSDDPIEQEGMRRAKQAIEHADRILWIADSREKEINLPSELINYSRLTIIKNKVDLTDDLPALIDKPVATIKLSAKTGAGMHLLKQHLKACMGFNTASISHFSARRRHLVALQHAAEEITHALQQLQDHRAGELVAEDLRLAQQALNEITGEFTTEDLLGKIFQNFCVGK